MMKTHLQQSFKDFPVTSWLLAVSLGVFLLMQLLYPFEATSARVIYQFGGMLGVAVQLDPSQIWRLFTPIFVHVGWQHMLFNGAALYTIGRQLEYVLGGRRFFALYLLSGIMGNAMTLLLTPTVVSAGASTSLYGMSAMMVVLRHYAHNPYLRQAGQSHLGFLVVNLLLSLVTPNMGHAGHFGGALGGALCAFLIPIRGEEQSIPFWQRLAALLAYIALLLVAFSRIVW